MRGRRHACRSRGRRRSEFQFNSTGIRLESDWNRAGIRLESDWNRAGIGVELRTACESTRATRPLATPYPRAPLSRSHSAGWNRIGIRLESDWNPTGIRLDSDWNSSRLGTGIVRFGIGKRVQEICPQKHPLPKNSNFRRTVAPREGAADTPSPTHPRCSVLGPPSPRRPCYSPPSAPPPSRPARSRRVVQTVN